MSQATTKSPLPTEGASHRDHESWLARYAELVALTAGIVLALLLITVPLPGDPMNYLEAAENLPSTPLHHGSTRLGLTVPAWLLTMGFGYSETSFYLLPILAFGGLAAATTFVGKRLYGHWVGLGAAALVLTSPWILPYGTQLLPDIPSAALLTLSVGLLLSGPGDDSSDTKAWLSGLTFGLAYLVKETSLLFGPALLGVILLRGHRWAFIGRFALAAGSVAILEALAGLALWGDPLAHLHSLIVRSVTVPTTERIAAFELAFAAQRNPITSFSIFPRLLWESWHGRFLLALGLAFAAAAAKGGTRFRALVAWILIPWVSLALVGSIHPESGRPIIRLMLDRYWAPLLPPLAIGGLGALGLLVGRLRLRSPQIGVVALAALVALTGVGIWLGIGAAVESRSDWFIHLGNSGYRELRTELHELEGAPMVYVDQRPSKLVRMYTRDPLGRPIFQGTLTHEPASIGDADIVLVDFLLSSDSTSVDPPVALAAHSLFAVSSDLRWAMYTNPDSSRSGAGISELDDTVIEPEAWKSRLVTDGEWGPTESAGQEAIVLTAEQTLVVFDNSGPYGAAPENSAVYVPAGSTVSFHMRLQSEGGRSRAICDFFPDIGIPRVRVSAAALLDVGPGDDIVTGVCEAPETEGPYGVRVVITLSGPARLELGEGRLVTYSSDTR